LRCLGKSHDELVASNVLPQADLEEIYAGSFTVGYEAEAGVELEFWAENKVFEQLHFTLAKRVPSATVFHGELDAPFGNCKNRDAVLQAHGSPIKSKAPFNMPLPMGEIGGWDIFDLTALGYEGLRVCFSYDKNLRVSAISFSVKMTGMDKILESRLKGSGEI
ncbi:DUF6392 family protein, partial [Citrobacter cronae]|uniref:DUF6392 family protein n=2 Tax=Gammaproteobacteria TaxID=1236 RepID=UPI0015D3CDBB